jgi:hypothetical protein
MRAKTLVTTVGAGFASATVLSTRIWQLNRDD